MCGVFAPSRLCFSSRRPARGLYVVRLGLSGRRRVSANTYRGWRPISRRLDGRKHGARDETVRRVELEAEEQRTTCCFAVILAFVAVGVVVVSHVARSPS